MKLKELLGSGDRIILSTLPFLSVGLALNVWRPSVFGVGGPSRALKAVSVIMLAVGVAIWLWSVVLVLTKVPRKELITRGPYALVTHPTALAVKPRLQALMSLK
jgi:protein-S-isoprenylcysteine O-methyltransferase Ste14